MTDLAHLIIAGRVRAGDWAIDATVGNGHDTAFLAAAVGPAGRVFGFDIQAQALAAARLRLGPAVDWVALTNVGHERLAEILPPQARGQIAAVMFNLGYLPGGDKAIITTAATTLTALRTALDLLRIGGIVTVVVYPAHPGGGVEADTVKVFAEQLGGGFAATHHTRLGRDHSKPDLRVPELLAIERVR